MTNKDAHPNHPHPLRGTGHRLMAGLGIAAAGTLALPGVAHAEPSQEEVEERIDELMAESDTLVQDYNEAEEDYEAAQARLDKLEEQIGDEEERYEGLRENVAEFASAAYQGNDLDATSTIISVDSPEDLLEHAADIEHLSESKQSELEEFGESAERLINLRDEAEETFDEAEERYEELEEMKEEVESELAEQEELLAEFDTSAMDGDSSGDYSGVGGGSALEFALAQVGKPYIWGGTGPDGYDCSGLMQASYANAGVTIPRTTYAQYELPNKVSRDALQPGDIMFFYPDIGHNGMYIGNGQMVHAPRTGRNIEVVNLADYWDAHFVGAVRP